MARINPKLNLNKTPQNAEDYSLVFAKNIKVTSDGSISRENNIYKLWPNSGPYDNAYILCCIPYTSKLYIVFIEKNNSNIQICWYDETYKGVYSDQFKQIPRENRIQTGAIYHGGHVDGIASVNLRGQVLITLNEWFDEDDENYIYYPCMTINNN